MRAAISDYHELKGRILALIGRGVHEPLGDEAFNALSMDVFRYQFESNDPYRRYCLKMGHDPESVKHWRDIPAVPTAAFKEVPLACFPPEQAERVFTTSGTTTPGKHGRHYMRSLELYNASLRPNFLAHVLPDATPMYMAILAPSAEALPTSSLSHMLEEVRKDYGKPGSAYYLGAGGLDYQGLERALNIAQSAGDPICLLGTAFAFVHFLDYCTDHAKTFRLPTGSRIMDTGGYKGRSREVAKEELYHAYEATFGVPQDHIVNEYGMTEMGTQFYDSILADTLRGLSAARHKVVPPWARTLVVDPDTLEPLPPGKIGVLRHLDLSNLSSVMAIQTEDLGYEVAGGFEVLGRAKGAEPRGCSIAVDEFLAAQVR